MAGSHTPAPIDPEALARASAGWHGFTQLMKYSLVAVVVILIGMAFFLL